MKPQDLLEKIAPCSLMCHTCLAYDQGVICHLSTELQKSLEGLDDFYKKNTPDQVESYQSFCSILKNFSSGYCSGCRSKDNNICSIRGCFLLECTKDHGVGYCGECSEFPCEKTKNLFEDIVYQQWLEGNKEIQEVGIEEFWNRNHTRPHYKAYIDHKDK